MTLYLKLNQSNFQYCPGLKANIGQDISEQTVYLQLQQTLGRNKQALKQTDE